MELPANGNGSLAGRLDEFAALLELAGADHSSARAYRRAAELIRAAPVAVAGLVEQGRVRELRGIGPSIEARLRELLETGEIAEVAQLGLPLPPPEIRDGTPAVTVVQGLDGDALRRQGETDWATWSSP